MSIIVLRYKFNKLCNQQPLIVINSFLLSHHLNAQISINEVQASNDNTIADNFLEYDDWIEIYNAGNAPLNLAGYYLSDNAASPLMRQIPATDAALTTVPAGGYLIF